MSAVGVAGKYFMLLLLGGPQSVHSTAASAAVRCDFGTNEHAITSPSAPTRAAAIFGTKRRFGPATLKVAFPRCLLWKHIFKNTFALKYFYL